MVGHKLIWWENCINRILTVLYVQHNLTRQTLEKATNVVEYISISRDLQGV